MNAIRYLVVVLISVVSTAMAGKFSYYRRKDTSVQFCTHYDVKVSIKTYLLYSFAY